MANLNLHCYDMRSKINKNKDRIRMLSHNQVDTIVGFYKLKNITLFSQIPQELMLLISRTPIPNSKIASDVERLLEHVVFDEPVEAKAMIEENPRLLLYAGNTIAPSGQQINRVTAYECALGSGNPRMKATIEPYFSKIENGEKERDAQYERYRKPIEDMLKQEPYDPAWLFDMIKECSDEDIAAALKLDTEHMSEELLNAFTKFRNERAPLEITGPRMHYNYRNLQYLFDMYDREFDHLARRNNHGNTNHDRCLLVWRQVVCFEMRNLPAIDRRIFARGLYYVVEKNAAVSQTFEFENDKGIFFPSRRDVGYGFHSGFSFDFGIDIFGYYAVRTVWYSASRHWKTCVEQKNQTCRTYTATPTSTISACNFVK